MVYLTDKKGKRPVVLNALVKKKKIKDEDFFCEIPTPELVCVNASKKFRGFRMTFLLMMLAFYCVTLAFVLKGRLTAKGTGIAILREFSKLSRRNLEDDFIPQRKILEISSTSIEITTTTTTTLPAIQQLKLADLKYESSGRYIASISSPMLHKKSMTAFGAWMKDPASSDDVVYVMDYYYRNTHVLAYETIDDFTKDVISTNYELPVEWGGTGHAVYKGHMYFNRYNSSTMCKYSFEKKAITISKNLPQAGFGNMSPYQWAGSTDIDFAVDADGLWVIYATPESEWNITISKLNEETLEIEKTWRTNYRKRSAANAFMVNGVLYTLHRYDSPQTMLNYAFDTSTSKYFWPKIPFNIKFGSVSSLDYDYREKKLYAWDRGHQVTYDVSFK